MSTVQLTLEYKKQHVPSVGYFMETIMKTTGTNPSDFYDCLVVSKGTPSAEESILRVATYAEIFTTPLDILPTTVDRFSAASLSGVPGGVQLGDEIHVVAPLPPIWQHIYGFGSGVFTVIAPYISPTEVVVTPAFPAFANSIAFEYWQGGGSPVITGNDGVANRDFSGVSGSFLRTQEHGDMWDDFAGADNAFSSLRAEAASLVDAYNEDTFSGDVEETYV